MAEDILLDQEEVVVAAAPVDVSANVVVGIQPELRKPYDNAALVDMMGLWA